MSIPWHYPRTELARTFIDHFASGISRSLTLFAPRRMGKTEFLIRDLGPLAERNGFLVIYASFWENPDAVSALISAVQESTEGHSFSKRVKKFLMTPLSSISFTVAGVGISSSLKNDQAIFDAADNLKKLSKLFHVLCMRNKKVLLLLDEVQQLAKDSNSFPLIGWLKTNLDRYSSKVFIVYTGSSRNGLQRLFKDKKAPLFNSSHQIDLPYLGEEFVKHMLLAYTKACGRKISLDKALQAFNYMHKVPFYFHCLLQQMIIQGQNNIIISAKLFIKNEKTDRKMDVFWCNLKPLEQAVLILLSKDSPIKLYDEPMREEIANSLGLKELSKFTIQNTLRKLKNENIIYSPAIGIWEIEDDMLREWIRSDPIG